MNKHMTLAAYLFLVPTIIGLLVFRIAPIVVSFIMSFTDWNVFSSPNWVGLANYKRMLTSDEFWSVFSNTLTFSVLYTVGVCVIGLFFAVILNEKLKGVRFFRSLFFLPVVTSVVAVGIVFNWILSADSGIINAVLRACFGVSQPPSWLGDRDYALYSLIFVYVWKSVGYQMILYLAGLQSIPRDVIEASKIDGANDVQSFFKVTLPLLTPIVFFVLIITMIQSFQTFGITYTMTQGGPYHATNTLSYYIYQNAFVHFNMGYASSMAYFLFMIILVITMVNFILKKRWVNYQ